MKVVNSKWLFQGKQGRKIVKLDTSQSDTLLHSVLTCVYHVYRKSDKYDKDIMISKLKMALIEHSGDEDFIYNSNYKKIIETLVNILEVNIFLFNCKSKDTIIDEVFTHSTESPYILIERCEKKFFPLGVKEKNGIHIMFFYGIDDDVIRCLNMYSSSDISKKYTEYEDTEDEIKIDMTHIFKYGISELLTSLKDSMLK